MGITVELKPSYEVPLVGVCGANAQTAIVSGVIVNAFRINGAVVIFGDDHIDNVLHYLLVGDTNNISTTNISEGNNIIPPPSPSRFFIGHSMIRKIHVIREYPKGDKYIKCHVVNNNAYAININSSIIIEEV